MKREIIYLKILFLQFFLVLLFFSISAGCHYAPEEEDYMRPLYEARKEVDELEAKKKVLQADINKEKKFNKQKRDSVKLLDAEIDSLKILIK